ncbi:MAG: site-specific integrase [Acidaminococcaceae bacterium]|nr:site-specific integrase [Acidaminococcaceae bacterium]
MSDYGSGSLKETKVGSYVYWTVRYYDNNGIQKAKRFPHTEQGKRDAKKFQKEASKKKSDGVLVSTSHTVASWCEEYIQTYKTSLRDSSLLILLQTFDKIEVSPIANVPLDKLNGAMVQNFYNMLADTWTDINGKEHQPIASSTISKVHKLLAAAYKKAVQLRIIGLNPMDTVESVKPHYKEKGVFTWREIGKIFRAIDKITANKSNTRQRYDFRLVFMLLLMTGCRVGELLALRWEDVNFNKREIHIHATKVRDKQDFNDTKTKAGRRFVPIINDKLLARLKEYRNNNGIIKLQGFIFEDSSGGAMEYRRIVGYWKRIKEITGITGNVHMFRHTFATYLLEKGIPVAEVSRILGHADATITFGMYTHSIPGYNQKIIEQFRQIKPHDRTADKIADRI